MKLTSPSFKNNELIDEKYSMYKENIFPGLEWSELPKNTKSLAIVMHDPDAPTQSGFWHLQILNISPSIIKIPSGKISDNVGYIRNNDFDQKGYVGPGTPKGRKHKYVFTLYALPMENIIKLMDSNLPVKHSIASSRALVGFFLENNNIGKAELIGFYDNR